MTTYLNLAAADVCRNKEMGMNPVVRRLRQDYFFAPERQMSLKKGDCLLQIGQINNRLYYIHEGSFLSSIPVSGKCGTRDSVAIFKASKGAFLGINSFFTYSHRASTNVVALKDARLAWIDHTTDPVREEDFGSLHEQFFPIIMEEMAGRQLRLARATVRHEMALSNLHDAERNLAMLGQLAAGLVHELNNAIGVLAQTSLRVQTEYRAMLGHYTAKQTPWFDRGLEHGQQMNSKVVREKAKDLEKRFGLAHDAAKGFARVLGDENVDSVPKDLDAVLRAWGTGRDFHDMALAARHAASIVRSVKLLGGGTQKRVPGVSINETFFEALSLLQSNLREVQVVHNLDPRLPDIYGSKTEFMQLFLNIIKNGSDALKETNVPSPEISVETLLQGEYVEIHISNNGPQIPKHIRSTLFQPNITSKRERAGESMGLGLGLYMVKKIVDSYNGNIAVESTPERTRFTLRLPVENARPETAREVEPTP